ncbi:hypothetical protein Hanom_Chr05g00416941 [Helianthus anomalus]
MNRPAVRAFDRRFFISSGLSLTGVWLWMLWLSDNREGGKGVVAGWTTTAGRLTGAGSHVVADLVIERER